MDINIIREKIKTIRISIKAGNKNTSDFLVCDLENYLTTRTKIVTVEMIVDTVVKITGISFETIKSDTRRRKAIVARCIINKLLMSECNYSTVSCGKFLGNRDHSTVLNSIKEWDQTYSHNVIYKSLFTNIQQIIKGL